MIVSRTMESYVLLALVETSMATTTLDLWMFQRGFDTFPLVVNYINK
jgi:hypothetical protein